MFGIGQRQIEVSIGIKAYLVPMELKKLSDDFLFWDKNKSFDVYEIASRLLTSSLFQNHEKNTLKSSYIRGSNFKVG